MTTAVLAASALRHSVVPMGILVLLATVVALLALASSPAESAFPGANGMIAFTTDRDGNNEVYVMNADGDGQTNLTNAAPRRWRRSRYGGGWV